jgi:hypothetical protein
MLMFPLGADGFISVTCLSMQQHEPDAIGHEIRNSLTFGPTASLSSG